MSTREQCPAEHPLYRCTEVHDDYRPGLVVKLICQREENGTSDALVFTVEALRVGLFRVRLFGLTHRLAPRTTFDDTPEPSLSLEDGLDFDSEKAARIGPDMVTASWGLRGPPFVSIYHKGQLLHQDLASLSYSITATGGSHYTWQPRNPNSFQLGANQDYAKHLIAVGEGDSLKHYQCYRVDYMFKNIPLVITVHKEGCIGVLYSGYSRAKYSKGKWSSQGDTVPFMVHHQEHGGLEQYIMVGDDIQSIINQYMQLVAPKAPPYVPRWVFGHVATGILLPPDSAAEITTFDFSGMNVSAVLVHQANPTPVPKANTLPQDVDNQARAYHKQGIRVILDVKNCLIQTPGSRPRFFDATGKAFMDTWTVLADGAARVGLDGVWLNNLWDRYPEEEDGNFRYSLKVNQKGGSLFISPKTAKDCGKTRAFWGRGLQTELMTGSAVQGFNRSFPAEQRQVILASKPTLSTMSYSPLTLEDDLEPANGWKGMLLSHRKLIHASALSQLCCHEIVVANGDQEPEQLFLRWIQLASHSAGLAVRYQDDANKLWMGLYDWDKCQGIREYVVNSIKRQHELIPYIYSRVLKTRSGKSIIDPVQRWIGWGYEDDPHVWDSGAERWMHQHWLGETLHVAGVFRQGAGKCDVYFPGPKEEYINLNPPYNKFKGGHRTTVDCNPTIGYGIPVFAKVGGAVVVGRNCATKSWTENTRRGKHGSRIFAKHDTYRAVEIFPPDTPTEGRTFSYTWYEDSGEFRPRICKNNHLYDQQNPNSFILTYRVDNSMGPQHPPSICVTLSVPGDNPSPPTWKKLRIIMPADDMRLVFSGRKHLPSEGYSRKRRIYILEVPDDVFTDPFENKKPESGGKDAVKEESDQEAVKEAEMEEGEEVGIEADEKAGGEAGERAGKEAGSAFPCLETLMLRAHVLMGVFEY